MGFMLIRPQTSIGFNVAHQMERLLYHFDPTGLGLGALDGEVSFPLTAAGLPPEKLKHGAN